MAPRMHGLHGETQVGFVNADADEYAVGHTAGHLQRFGTLRGNPNRNRGRMPEHRRPGRCDRDTLTRGQPLDRADGRFEGRNGCRALAHQAHGRVTHAQA